MSKSQKKLFIIGLALTTIGSFLPWQLEGDFLFFWQFGVRIFPSFEDNGGLLVLLLSLTLAYLIFRSPGFIKKPERWIIVLSIFLTLVTILYVARWFVVYLGKMEMVGAPTIQIGLIMVLLGSITLLITSLSRTLNHPYSV